MGKKKPTIKMAESEDEEVEEQSPKKSKPIISNEDEDEPKEKQ